RAARVLLHRQGALAAQPALARLGSIGLDAWGCDYGLLGESGDLLGNPYHYRDARTDGVMDDVFARVTRARIYEITGIQFLTFNTVYQLIAAGRPTPPPVDPPTPPSPNPGPFHHWLTPQSRSQSHL